MRFFIFIIFACCVSYVDSFASSISENKSLRVGVFQAPLPRRDNNPISVLKQVAESLRVASISQTDFVLFPELFLSGLKETKSFDRECYELNIIGNICEELNVACAIGYSEKKLNEEKTEMFGSPTTKKKNPGVESFNSVAVFNADGTRAANFRCTCASSDFLDAHPFVEVFPITLRLPSRKNDERKERNVKIGMAIGKEIWINEHLRHLKRSGAELLLSSCAFFQTDLDEEGPIFPLESGIHQVRAIENHIPVVYSNYVGSDDEKQFSGLSAIVDQSGNFLVEAPESEDGDMRDCGYLLPCEYGTLLAADITLDSTVDTNGLVSSSDLWTVQPRSLFENDNTDKQADEKRSTGFHNSKQNRRSVKTKKKKGKK
ncbi:hypothetical protein CTEN210_07989 [Chaetoceros tenuissimus]|uniref:CN hydrolase domain-containing protein n=1 Tax=Chaetoceros tenuissimus TaxID=426638 RepID=A0AAD3H676_9STRA|nr:hypothetical protein CTEN210_07989 [Chaetoceros tenuissimus]